MNHKKSRAALRSEFRGHLRRFMEDITKKLLRNEERYQWGNLWKIPDWREKLQSDLPHHVAKGDARDVAIYAFFAWYHRWSTAAPSASRWVPTSSSLPTPPVGIARRYWAALPDGTVKELSYAFKVATESEDYTGWAIEDEVSEWLHPYKGPLPTHYMEQEPAPAHPGKVTQQATALYNVGELVMVEITDENEFPRRYPFNIAGDYPAAITRREEVDGFGWYYRVSFSPSLAPEHEARMGYSYPEARIRKITDEEMEAMFPDCVTFSDEPAGYKLNDDSLNELYLATIQKLIMRPTVDVEALKSLVAKLNPGTLPGKLMDAIAVEYANAERMANYNGPASQYVERNATTAAPKYHDNQLVWVRVTDGNGGPIGVFPAIITNASQLADDSFAYLLGFASHQIPNEEARAFMRGVVTEDRLEPRAMYIMGQHVLVEVEGTHYDADIVKRTWMGGDGWVYKVQFDLEEMKGMGVFDYVERRIEPIG